MSFNYKLLIRDCKRKRARDLDLSGQEISIIPDETFGLTFVKTLILANNGLTGLDDRIAELTDLETIDLRNNLFTKFPFVLLKLPKLKTVCLSGNQFSDEFSFLNSVGDSLDEFRSRLKALHDRSMQSFKDDFFSDDDFELTTHAKTQIGFTIKPHTESRTASPTSDSHVQSLQTQVQKLTLEIQNLQSHQLTRLKSQNLGDCGSDLPVEIQIRSPTEVKSIEKLSQGGFSIIERGVYKGTAVAIKHFFDPSKLSEVKEEFLTEVKMLNKLRHPNIITLIGYHLPTNGTDNFLVFEFLPKGNLYEFLHVKRVKFDKKAFLLKLAEVMNFIHLSSVCHRDLKSLNIMIAGDNSPKLIDFGLARNFEDLNRGTNKFAATAAYSAPELFIQKELTSKVDVYAFGVLMWEVLNEDVPFRSMPMGDIKKFVLDKNILSCKGLSTAYAEVIQKCCAYSPEARPSFSDIIKMIERIPN